ncbi:hypothetical protein Ancab_011070, partial [Ancistrocladus abbreviatus]
MVGVGRREGKVWQQSCVGPPEAFPGRDQINDAIRYSEFENHGGTELGFIIIFIVDERGEPKGLLRLGLIVNDMDRLDIGSARLYCLVLPASYGNVARTRKFYGIGHWVALFLSPICPLRENGRWLRWRRLC